MNVARTLAGSGLLTSLLIFAAGCGGTATETTKTDATPLTKEALFRRGHQFYLQQQHDSAQSVLKSVLTMDANYREAIADLAALHYDLAMRSEAGKPKAEQLKESREYYVKLESLGSTDSDTYERLCEIANALSDSKTFLRYAKKNVDHYPFDRQYYNLSVACFEANDYQGAIKAMKEAVEKFRNSSYIGSFYRQLGRAYTKVDRDQTAEKTFYTGLAAADRMIADLKKRGGDYKSSPDYARLKDDKIGMLASLKNLHTTYQAMDKLADVEKKLKELGR
ncbi:MAG: hypothetical protein HY961_20770 [Ignavibacteriae bacterium]|nr:hypothetical protein [Ignavibacteriota bacterium]